MPAIAAVAHGGGAKVLVLKPASKTAVYPFIHALDLFGIGASWGGFESLIQPTTPVRICAASRWTQLCGSISA